MIRACATTSAARRRPAPAWIRSPACVTGPFGPVTEVFIDGNPLPRTPEWIFNFILQYTHPLQNGDLYFNTDWNYRDESNLFLH